MYLNKELAETSRVERIGNISYSTTKNVFVFEVGSTMPRVKLERPSEVDRYGGGKVMLRTGGDPSQVLPTYNS